MRLRCSRPGVPGMRSRCSRLRVGVLRGRPGRNACDAPPVEAGVGQQLRRVVWRRQRRCVDCVQHLQTPNTWTCRGAPPAPWTRRQRLNQPRRIQRWRWRESCGPVLQVGGVGGRALGPRHGPSRSVADLKTLLQRQGATTMPRTDLRPQTSSISEGVRFFVLSPRASAPSARGPREMREFPGLARLVLR